MNREQAERIEAIREGLRKHAEISGRIWAKLNERHARFDTGLSSLSPCEEATLYAQAAEDVLADVELALALDQIIFSQASAFRDAAVIEMNNRCVV